MRRFLCLAALTVVASTPLNAQRSAPPLFDGRPMDVWVAKVLDDTSDFRRRLAISAVRRAPPEFRRDLVRRLVPTLERGSAELRQRAVGVLVGLVNEGQAGQLLPDRERDLGPAVDALTRMAQDPANPQRAAVWFLLIRTDSATRTRLAPLARLALRDAQPLIRRHAIWFLGRLRDSVDFPRLLAAARDTYPSVRGSAIWELGRWQPRRAIPAFIAALSDSVPSVRAEAIVALGRAGPAASEAIPIILQLVNDTTASATGSFAESIRADAAWALSWIIPRRGRSATPMRVEVMDVATAVRSDGLGPYFHGADSIQVWQGAMLNLELAGPRGDGRATALKTMRTLRRSLLIDLSRPVPSSGAVPLGVIRDNETDVHMAYAHVHRRNMISIATLDPTDTIVNSERVEFQFRIAGEPHQLQMGEWTAGEFIEGVPQVHGTGTSSARIAHRDLGTWTVSAPPGSMARLWNLNDPLKPVDRGLYFLPFDFQWSLADAP